MDIFSTTITAAGLVLQFVGACSEFSQDARSLKARLEWDLRALKAIRDYFQDRRRNNANQNLPADDAVLLESTAEYLESLVGNVQKSFRKIQRKGLLNTTITRTMWVFRRAEIKEMEKEVRDWTERFGVRVLALPDELRTAISIAGERSNKAQIPAVVRSRDRLQDFLALSSSAKHVRTKEMLLNDPNEVIFEIEAVGDVSNMPLDYGAGQVIFSSRAVSEKERRPGDFEALISEMGELAAALSCLDPAADVRLLRTTYYFYYEKCEQFLFAHVPPYEVDSMITLEAMIDDGPYPEPNVSLSQRLRIAYKLAEAVLFLHTAGFLHKNITSSSVVLLQRAFPESGEVAPYGVFDDAYLMGFDLIREAEASTYKTGTSRRCNDHSRSMWDFDIYQHPDRLQGEGSPRYIKTYDVYSLGVLLLEIGLWEPLRKVVPEPDMQGGSLSWALELPCTTPVLGPRVGEKYRRMIDWCLSLTGDRIVKDTEFVQQVLDPLEAMMHVLA
ncbi:hypothetical protein DBV05_g10699 [Lasiodiplodia theobromae]|uniref:Protein kinase domain-containing protein n=1 Tax=Lasiodiplodia theobromae TaxID=45133 RepID=A0A5N5CZE0_9PEZI|nr:hypothetical protein DBV05_g10699 [Lasiodiplodia theobromae]